MNCDHCGYTGFHLCPELLKRYHEQQSPDERAEQRAKMKERLDAAIAASKELREKYGVVLVCNQRNIDYLESRTVVEDLDTDLPRSGSADC